MASEALLLYALLAAFLIFLMVRYLLKFSVLDSNGYLNVGKFEIYFCQFSKLFKFRIVYVVPLTFRKAVYKERLLSLAIDNNRSEPTAFAASITSNPFFN